MYKAGGEKKFDNKLWEAYKEANIKFAEVVSSIYQVFTVNTTICHCTLYNGSNCKSVV
jgi:hypothetical protein